jgi:hypothetical protein
VKRFVRTVRKVHGHAKRVCKWVKYVPHHGKS